MDNTEKEHNSTNRFHKSGTYDELFKLAKLPTLKNKQLSILMYKVKNELCPLYNKEMFQNKNINRYGFRNSDFVIPRFNTMTYGKHSLRYLGAFLWSNLDKKVRISESGFKHV